MTEEREIEMKGENERLFDTVVRAAEEILGRALENELRRPHEGERNV
jgi:hypothetical protein